MKINLKYLLLMAASTAFFKQAIAQDAAMQRTPKGLNYHIYAAGSGDKAKIGDVITFNVVEKTEKDSVLFSTYVTHNPVKIQVQPSQNIGDLMEVFALLAAKDSAVVKLPTDSIFKGNEDKRPPFLPKGSNLVFQLKMERVQNFEDATAERNADLAKVKAANDALKAAEFPAMQKYIADRKLIFKTTPSGLKYTINKPSIKPKPLKGDTVYVNYIGRTLDGKIFDSSLAVVAQAVGLQQDGRVYEPLSLVLGTGQVIKGWDEALLLMNEGSKATVLIPSALAYGDKAAGPDIKPYSTLLFDLELVKVRRIHHAPVKKKYVAKKAVKK